jgi:hypothetical protein
MLIAPPDVVPTLHLLSPPTLWCWLPVSSTGGCLHCLQVKRRAALADTHPADVGGGGMTMPGAGPGSVRLPPSATRIAAAQQIAASEAKARFTGGGFNIQA